MKHKILSFLTAFAMVFGIIAAPFVNASADDDEKTETVTIHKVLMDNDSFDAFTEGEVGKDGRPYVGKEITNPQDYFLGKEGNRVKDAKLEENVKGVYFAWKTENGKYIKAAKGDKLSPAFEEDGKTLATTTDVKEAMGSETGNDGTIEFKTASLPAGSYIIDEVEELTTYKKDGKLINGSKAVPVKITLPLQNETEVVKNAHVYPKNKAEKPKVNKDFSKEFENNKNGRDFGKSEEDVQKNTSDSEKEKEENWEPHNVGDVVNYTVKTEIPKNVNYGTLYWNDEMTDGLTFNQNSITLSYSGNNNVNLEKTTDYKITPSAQGFELEFTKAGLEKVNKKTNVGVITITYSATLNQNAVSAIPESNDVNFFYGNNPRKGNTPKPNYPDDNGTLKVTKTWDDGEWAEGESATFRLVDAQTGKIVTKEDLVGAPEDYTFEAEKTIGYNQEDKTAEWKYLRKDRQYKAVEIKRTEGTEASYEVNEKGKIVVVNHKTDNPQPINPTEPKVVTYDKLFVKRDKNKNTRLEGAVFVVKKGEKYLKLDSSNTADKNVQDKKAALDQAVNAYNENKDKEKTKELKKAVDKAQVEYNNAVYATQYKYTEVNSEKEATKFTSNKDGQVAVKGISEGKYTLVEIEAPSDYAVPSNNTTDFSVGKTATQNDDYYDLDSKRAEKTSGDKDATRINNQKVSIPQTGGIGSIIFVVAGLMIMGLAAYKMKANKEQA